MKKALQLASVASMIDQFNMPNIELLKSLGYQVDVVADFTNPGTIDKKRTQQLIKNLESMDVRVIDIPIPRKLDIKLIINAYKRVKELIYSENYKLIHCHSPIGGVIARLAAKDKRKDGTKLIYTAHGFHFYHGAPIQNWLVYYPVELVCSRWTDIIITINQEDYLRATQRLKCRRVFYIPGIGIDIKKFSDCTINREQKRKELLIPQDSIILLSVGELNRNKNHTVIIKALSKIYNKNLHYVIAGKGELENQLQSLANELGIGNRIHLLGYRSDILYLYQMADIFVLPSFREGLNVSLMEAMASRLPCISSRIRGNVDLITNEAFTANPNREEEWIEKIQYICTLNLQQIGHDNYDFIQSFGKEKIKKIMYDIYSDCE